MREALRVRHYSYRTEQAYVDWARRARSAGSVVIGVERDVPLRFTGFRLGGWGHGPR